MGLSATWRRVRAIRWQLRILAWLSMGLLLAICSGTDGLATEETLVVTLSRPALNSLADDVDWTEATRNTADRILSGRPSMSLEELLLELLKDRDHQTRRNALDAVARIGPSREVVRQVSLLADRDPDPLCQAKARLFLAEFSSTVPRRLPDTSDAVLPQSRDGSKHGHGRSHAASTVIRPPSMRDRIEPSDGRRVDTADFRVVG